MSAAVQGLRHHRNQRVSRRQGDCPIRAGLDITCNLQVDNELAAFARLQAVGIDTMPLARYCIQPRGPGLVLGFAPYDERAIEDAAKAVAIALKQ